MLTHLRKRLIILYTITAGAILTAAFVILAIFLNYQRYQAQQQVFTNHVYTLKSKLLNDTTIADSWLSNLEINNKLVIYIVDNGNELFFSGRWSPSTDRHLLIDKAMKLADKDGVSLYKSPISAESIQSEVYKIKGSSSDEYYATVLSVNRKKGFCSFVLLQSLDESKDVLVRELLFLALLDLIGICSLFLLIRKLVDHSLRPVKENQQRQTQFIAAASHELRSPLAVIRANNSLTKVTQEENLACEHIIEAECNRMSRLINDMLLLASGDANTWTLQKEEINLDTLLLEAYESSSIIADNKKISIRILLPDADLPVIKGDYDRILQVLLILLDNAIYYSSEHSSIEISASIEKKYLSIHIIDHGIGITDEDKLLIFDRFYRVDQSRKDKSHFGLGLSIAKELIALHHGTIKVTDTKDGGATFTIRFPYSFSY